MPRSPAKFTERDVKRAVAGVRAAGCEVVRVEIGRNDGRIIVISKAAEAVAAPKDHLEEWEAGRNGSR